MLKLSPTPQGFPVLNSLLCSSGFRPQLTLELSQESFYESNKDFR